MAVASLETFDVDPDHPLVIEPERYHHVELNGHVKFQIEFYRPASGSRVHAYDSDAVRPGITFLY